MNLLDIPGETFTHILPKLTLNDVLRFRRTCKFAKSLADDHIRLYVNTDAEVIIGSKDGYQFDKFSDDHFTRVVTMLDKGLGEMFNHTNIYKKISMESLMRSQIHLPATRFNLQFKKTEDVFGGGNGKWNMPEFLEKYGQQITHLRLKHFYAPLNKTSNEAKFIESLPNLKHLEIGELEVNPSTPRSVLKKAKKYFPSTFQNIEFLVVDTFSFTPSRMRQEYFLRLVQHCPKLETLRLPCFCLDEDADEDSDYDGEWEFAPYMVDVMIKLLHHRRNSPRSQSTVKYLDLDNFKYCSVVEDVRQNTVSKLVTMCVEDDVKLINVPMELIKRSPAHNHLFSQCVMSVIHARPTCMPGNYANLEKVYFHMSEFGAWERLTTTTPTWPKLTTIVVNVNNMFLQTRHAETLFNLLFQNCQRPLVTDLFLKYEATGPQVPKARNLVAACGNLTKLTLNNWPGTNKSLSILWTGLTKLEQVCLENCPGLGNVAFVGENQEDPAFLKLTNLKKLSLVGIDKMPKITDTVFQRVFRHLKVPQFHLTSWKENEIIKVKSITRSGIESLLTGDFANHIEIFPFDCWALADMNQTEFHTLRDKFRSSH